MEYIEREDILKLFEGFKRSETLSVAVLEDVIKTRPAADVVPVVRCKDCKHGILDGVEWWQCCKDADYDEETRIWYGFISHNKADWFCADGQRRE